MYVDNMPNGKGTYKWANGDLYIGQWKHGYIEGWGKKVCTDGSYYEGQWVRGTHEGSGDAWDAKNRVRYIGMWKAGKYHGFGALIIEKNGVMEEGEFIEGMRLEQWE